MHLHSAKSAKDILLDSHTITTVGIRANKYYGADPIRAQASRIYLWFVVNCVAYGDSLRFFCEDKTDDDNDYRNYKIMRTRHFFIALMLATLPLGEALADGVRFLVVNAKDGTKTTFALADEPKVLCKVGKLEIVSKSATFSLSLADVSNYAFSKESTGINEVEKEGNLRMENGRVVIDGLRAGGLVSAYTQDGRLVKDFKADENGTAIVDLSDLSKGIVILHSNKTDIKMINR